MAACIRSRTPSLLKILLTWFLAVPSVIDSATAISRLLADPLTHHSENTSAPSLPNGVFSPPQCTFNACYCVRDVRPVILAIARRVTEDCQYVLKRFSQSVSFHVRSGYVSS